MKIAVVGSRTFSDNDLLSSILNKFDKKIITIISGGAAGADKLAENWADKNNVKKIICKPDWKNMVEKLEFYVIKILLRSQIKLLPFGMVNLGVQKTVLIEQKLLISL